MTIETAKPVKRRSLLRLVVAGVALGLIGVAVDRLVLTPGAQPALVQELAGDWDAKSRGLRERVAARYPAGSSEAALKSELAEQGFAVAADTAKWSQASSGCREFVEIGWSAQAGRITATRASMFQACT